jgi:hypothetical protein
LTVAGQPDFVEVPERLVAGNLVRRQVAMVIEDRFFGRVVVVQLPRHVGVQQEILGDERAHRPRLVTAQPLESQARLFSQSLSMAHQVIWFVR